MSGRIRGHIARVSTFRRGFVSAFGMDVLARALAAIATVLFIRGLSVESFAYLVLFLNVGQFAGSALTGGVRMRYLRTEAERVSRGSTEPTGFSLALSASMMLVLGAAALGIAGVALLDTGGSWSSQWLFVILAATFTSGHASIELAMVHRQAHLRFLRSGVIGVARSAAILLIALLVSLGVVGSGPTAAAAVGAAVLLVGAVVCAPLVRQSLFVPALSAFRGEFGRESGWLSVYYLTSAGFAYANIFVVGALLDAESIASYGAALRYLSIVLGPMPALLAVLRVRTSQRDLVDSRQLQVEMLVRWIKRAALPVIAVVGAAELLAPTLIPLLDDGKYPQSVPIFQLLLISAIFIYAMMPGPNLLMTQRRYKLLAGFFAIAFVVQVTGATIAASISGVVAVAAVAAVVGSAASCFVALIALRVRAGTVAASETP